MQNPVAESAGAAGVEAEGGAAGAVVDLELLPSVGGSVFADRGVVASRIDVSEALRGMKAGSVTEDEAVELLEQLMDGKLDARIDTLREELAVGSIIEGANSVLARFGAAPTNWHQATIYFLTSTTEEDAAMRKRAPVMFAAGLVMIVVQIIAVYGIIMGMMGPPCISNLECDEAGSYCQTAPDGKSGRVDGLFAARGLVITGVRF